MAMMTNFTQDNDSTTPAHHPQLPRRSFLSGTAQLAAAGALAGWVPIFRVPYASAQATCATPQNFPAGITLYQQAYENWAKEVRVDSVWTCAPQTPAQVVTIANWARVNGYKIRPRGKVRNWSPLILGAGGSCPKVVLVDTTQYLTAISVNT